MGLEQVETLTDASAQHKLVVRAAEDAGQACEGRRTCLLRGQVRVPPDKVQRTFSENVHLPELWRSLGQEGKLGIRTVYLTLMRANLILVADQGRTIILC